MKVKKKIKSFFRKRSTKIAGMLIFCILATLFYFSLPDKLFKAPFSTVLLDRKGELLGAAIADDGQWRFPPLDSIPAKYKTALLTFEDKYFYSHPGVNPVALVRAAKQNFQKGRVHSGGSTLTMQVARMLGKNQPRTYWQKLKEIIVAFRLETAFSKDKILNLHISNAPYGGNIVGLNAATWRYFNRNPHNISWSEAALLAVLPNSPSLMYPGKNIELLKAKRDRLLDKLYQDNHFDSLTLVLAKAEPVPDRPQPLPLYARHLLVRSIKEGKKGKIIKTTIDLALQRHVNDLVNRHHEILITNGVHNAAALILDVENGDVLAYIGNVDGQLTNEGTEVDIITSPRSTGSILKPFLYASMLNEGFILPGSLIPDIPTFLNGFAPKNFSKQYDGAVAANNALARSLNVPAVLMLQNYGIEKLQHKLSLLQLSHINKPASHYGLSIILGGAESSLWDVSSAYASMARSLTHYFKNPPPNRYNEADYFKASYVLEREKKASNKVKESRFFDAGTIWLTFEALLEVNRPEEESNWQLFDSGLKVSWKTGTSFGHRDAWAVGLNPRFVVGVWVGNADGEGRPGLTGASAAAPILFDIFSTLPHSKKWFEKPGSSLARIPVCRQSGYRISKECPQADTIAVQLAGLQTNACPFHQLVHLEKSRSYRVNADCESTANMVTESFFLLPPVQEYYYKQKNPSYRSLPPLRSDCQVAETGNQIMEMIYPRNLTKVIIPRELDGNKGSAIFEVAHRRISSRIFWHLDGVFLGETSGKHQMALSPPSGYHRLTLVDENGETLNQNFKVIDFEAK